MEKSAIVGTNTEAVFNRVLAANLVQGNYLELLLYWRQKKYLTVYHLKSKASFNELED